MLEVLPYIHPALQARICDVYIFVEQLNSVSLQKL